MTSNYFDLTDASEADRRDLSRLLGELVFSDRAGRLVVPASDDDPQLALQSCREAVRRVNRERAGAALPLVRWGMTLITSTTTLTSMQASWGTKPAGVWRRIADNCNLESAIDVTQRSPAPCAQAIHQRLSAAADPNCIGNVIELLQSDQSLSPRPPKTGVGNIKQSLQHPDVVGITARHARKRGEPPRNPLNLTDCQAALTALLNELL